jgi:WD40 repeat protein
MASQPEDTRDPLECLTDEFLERHRSGEAVDAESFAEQHPEHADRIRELFPLLLQLEGTRAPEPAQPRERIGRWRVVRELGRGGMGVIYLAQDDQTGARAALKLMSAESPDAVTRFRREAEAVSRVEHPGICRVLEVSAAGDRLWIAFEYIEGETLADALRRERRERADVEYPPPRDARRWLDVGGQVAVALHAAHEVGLIHRDVTPGNIMLGPEGRAVVLDFGLAHGELDQQQTRLTQTGVPIGTPTYMSPEQVRAGSLPLDRTTDVYSLGATLYEALTLEPPFAGPTIASLFSQILSAEPAPARRHVPALSRDIEVVLATALEKNPKRRYATSQALAEDLGRAAQGARVRARPASPLRRTAGWAVRHPAAAAVAGSTALALVTGLVVALVLLARVQKARDGERAAARRVQARALVAASAEAQREDAMLALLLAREAARIERSPETTSRLHAAVDGSLERARLPGHGGAVSSLAWDDRGQRVATGASDGRGRLFDENGTLLTTVKAAEQGAEGHVRVALAPFGARMTTIHEDGTARLWSETGRELAVLSGAGSGARGARFLSDGSAVVLHNDGGITIHEPEGPVRVSFTVDMPPDARLPAFRAAVVTVAPPLLHVLTRDSQAISYDPQGKEVLRRLQAKDGTFTRLLAGGWLSYMETPEESRGPDQTVTVRTVAPDGAPAGSVTIPDFDQASLFGTDTWWGAWTRAGGATIVAPAGTTARQVTLDMKRSEPPWLTATPANGSRLLTARALLTSAGAADADVDPIRLWAPRGIPLAALTVGKNYVSTAAFSPDGERIALAGHTGDLATVHATAPTELATVVTRWSGAGIRYAAPMTPDGGLVFVFESETRCRVMRDDGSVHARFEMPPCGYLDMLPDRGLVLATERGGGARVVDMDGTMLVQLGSESRTRVAFFLGSDGAFVTMTDETVRFHDPVGAVLREVEGKLIQVAPQRSYEEELAVVSAGQLLIHGPDGTLVRELPLKDRERPVWYCGSPSGRSLFVVRTGMVSALCRCCTASGEILWEQPLGGIGGMITVLSRDGSRALFRTSGGLSLRDADNGQELAHLPLSGGVTYAEIDRHSRQIVAGSISGHVYVWDREGRPLFQLPHQGGRCLAHVSRDGRRIAVVGTSMARLYTTDTDELEALARKRSTRDFSEAERAQYSDILEPRR